MRRLILIVILIDLALIAVAFSWRKNESAAPSAPAQQSDRQSEAPAERLLSRVSDIPWWLRDPNAAQSRYTDYDLVIGKGEALTQSLARDAAMLDAASKQTAADSSKLIDKVSLTGLVALEEFATQQTGTWRIHILAGKLKQTE